MHRERNFSSHLYSGYVYIEAILMERKYEGDICEMQETLFCTWDEYHSLIRKEIVAGVGVNKAIAKILRRFSKFRRYFHDYAPNLKISSEESTASDVSEFTS